MSDTARSLHVYSSFKCQTKLFLKKNMDNFAYICTNKTIFNMIDYKEIHKKPYHFILERLDPEDERVPEAIITYDDHANVFIPGTDRKMGTFRTYTLKIEGSLITLKNITVENNAARLGQAVALHTEGDRLCFVNCRFLGNQDTVYTGMGGTRLYFRDCYIEGTTDFIFGPSTAWFEHCTIRDMQNSYVTAASTPKDQAYGYIFNHCRIDAEPGVDKCYLGRPWRPWAYTLFMNCDLGAHIRPEGW